MLNLHPIAVFDFETDSADPRSCNPVELACLVLDPRTLEIVPNSEFSTKIRPPSIDDTNYYELHKDTIEWHAKNHKCTSEDILKEWKSAIPQDVAWKNFKEYLSKYHTTTKKRSMWSAPIAAGMNIIRFDLPIIERLSGLYGDLNSSGETKIFFPRDRVDLMPTLFMWFENMEEPSSYSMDVCRPFFGIDDKNSHEAIKDVQDTAKLISKFMKLHRYCASKVTTFKGA
jgi:DNA polymerase III epsilon subunit-like protein